MNRHLGGVSNVHVGIKSIAETGATHNMNPTYESFLYYHHYSSGEYVTLVNGSKDPVSGYSTNLVWLGGKLI